MSRPDENRVRIVAHVEKATNKRIRRMVKKRTATNTIGKVLDAILKGRKT